MVIVIISIFLPLVFILSQNYFTNSSIAKSDSKSSIYKENILIKKIEIEYIDNKEKNSTVLIPNKTINKSHIDKEENSVDIIQIKKNTPIIIKKNSKIINSIESSTIKKQEPNLSNYKNTDEEYIDFEDSYLELKKTSKVKFNKPQNIVYTTSKYEKSVLKSRIDYEKPKKINTKADINQSIVKDKIK